MSNEITSVEYWDRCWEGLPVPQYDVRDPYFKTYLALFGQITRRIKRESNRAVRIVDVGCGNGLMLRFFKEQFACEVTGIDFSAVCHQAKSMADKLGLEANVYQYDLFDNELDRELGKFDIVASFGLVEHFRDPLIPLRRMRGMLQEGGYLVTVVPNFHGMFNCLWRLYDSENYSHHIPITVSQLVEMYGELRLADIEVWSIGREQLPNVHDKGSHGRRLLATLVNLVNSELRILVPPPKSRVANGKVGMVPNVCVFGSSV